MLGRKTKNRTWVLLLMTGGGTTGVGLAGALQNPWLIVVGIGAGFTLATLALWIENL